ncbi:uncharacterized protein LOC131154947 isoform X2 [Malania oleifera]|uniref:uncharacterized protein LOC131154947 isoform X2 n=1 Tax=Malania oleifera TaxID=397392 RepID=UPI0025AE93C0|nr:uncharacterized protein LOC131154947 isoform X2 [Malania oleifera]
MSRREGRESDSKRHRSRFDREPSPKRSRRDGKPETERKPSNFDMDVGGHTDRDQKHRRRLQDALPLEAALAPGSKEENGAVNKVSDKKTEDKKTEGRSEGTKHSSDPTEVPRSRSYFQHDERGSSGQGGRSFGRRATVERGWWRDSKDQHGTRVPSKTAHETQQKNEKSLASSDDNRVWHHDGFFEMEADPPPPPVRKRPAFREKKIPVEAENADKALNELVKAGHANPATLGVERREERMGSERREERGRNHRHFDRSEKPFARDRIYPNRGEPQAGFLSRERYGGGGGGGGSGYRGRERPSGRQGSRFGRVEKWKHDLFDEANRSPTPKNEEDQIAKVEALLAS